ncbi:DUF3375 domain-containing protein [Microbacterium oryzae]|uniref:DUF3375 domain-containing protein n=1 Tax=Microbacterium oryzae TaxID=743009 RepID=UPI0025AF5953|nr:DUF3375 domain-containing protein [Microbacterium oryzae]MDN3311362.1 DUF3375 domain-containing protein [Microbacterium oryzae]
MSGVSRDAARLTEAREGAALGLVRSRWAPLIIAVFHASFSQEVKRVRAERLHVQVDTYLHELRDAGFEVPAQEEGRALCLSWMRSQWLRRVPLDDGGEAYELTSHALAAMRMHSELSRERALLSESRLTTILDAVRRWATEANPDETARVAALDAEIARLSAERDRLVSGGEVAVADDERMLGGYADLVDLLDQLPGDFRRVEEALDAIHDQMVRDFRAEERPKGEVLGDYLAASTRLASQTREGRAFQGALTVLGDEELLATFREDLRAIMTHPFARDLSPEDRVAFVNADAVLRRGLRDVQTRQQRASQSLAEYLAAYDSMQERELTRTLRRVEQELAVWMETARARDTVPLPWMPARLEMEHLRTRFHDPSRERPAPPLEDVSDQAPPPPLLDDVRRQGGPLLGEVRAALASAAAGGAETLSEAFNALPADLRRPVEVFGVAHLAAEHGLPAGLADDGGVVRTVRPDGTVRAFALPALQPPTETPGDGHDDA